MRPETRGRTFAGSGRQPGDVLRVEEAVRWTGSPGAARTAFSARRERTVEADRGGSDAGLADLAGDRRKKAVKPRHRRRLAGWVKETYRISERRSARILGMA